MSESEDDADDASIMDISVDDNNSSSDDDRSARTQFSHQSQACLTSLLSASSRLNTHNLYTTSKQKEQKMF